MSGNPTKRSTDNDMGSLSQNETVDGAKDSDVLDLIKIAKIPPSSPTLSYTVVLTLSEAAHFEANLEEIASTLKNVFHIRDFSVSPQVQGSIDRFAAIFGHPQAISRACAYVAFLLRKLNCAASCSLDSRSYSIDLLLAQSRPINPSVGSALAYFDMVFPSHYHPEIGAIKAKGGISELSRVLESIARDYIDSRYVDTSDWNHLIAFGNHTDPNLFVRSDENAAILRQ